MKSSYIIAGGILVMVAVVFLAPKKQNNTEDKASIPLDEIDAIILKEYGDDLTPEEKELPRQEIEEDLARDKAEMRQYGRLLTNEERAEQWWEEQDEAAERAAYAKLYAERKEWIDNFPFRPGYHPDIVYDPENNIAHSAEKYQNTDNGCGKNKRIEELEEKSQRFDPEIWDRARLLREEIRQASQPDPEIEEQRHILKRHKKVVRVLRTAIPLSARVRASLPHL